MNEGAVRKETGVGTLDTLRRLNMRIARLEKSVATAINNGYLVASHADLADLSYSASGHTGFASTTALTAHTGNTSNPHSVTHTQVNATRIYSQATEPSSVTEFAVWYKPAVSGVSGSELWFNMQGSDDTWYFKKFRTMP